MWVSAGHYGQRELVLREGPEESSGCRKLGLTSALGPQNRLTLEQTWGLGSGSGARSGRLRNDGGHRRRLDSGEGQSMTPPCPPLTWETDTPVGTLGTGGHHLCLPAWDQPSSERISFRKEQSLTGEKGQEGRQGEGDAEDTRKQPRE